MQLLLPVPTALSIYCTVFNISRHIAIRYFFVKDRIESKEVDVQYCPTEMLTADILTKPLVGTKFYQHRHALLNLPGTFDRRGVLEFGN